MEEAHWPKDREDAVASIHTVNLGSGRCNPTELDGFKAVNTEELDKVKASRDKYKTVRSRHAAYQRTQKTYRPLNRKCQKRLELPDSQRKRGTSGIEQS
jgi:hypothetical protein